MTDLHAELDAMNKLGTVTVTIERDYGDCGNMDGGCSGWESVEVIATDGKHTESAKKSSCFGVSEAECFQEVLNKWNQRILAIANALADKCKALEAELQAKDKAFMIASDQAISNGHAYQVAMDENKRLREALERIAGQEIRDDLNYYNARAMIEHAREALNPQQGEK